jgi:hypothetical protein
VPFFGFSHWATGLRHFPNFSISPTALSLSKFRLLDRHVAMVRRLMIHVLRHWWMTGIPEVDTDARWWSYNDLAQRGGIYANGERCFSISG